MEPITDYSKFANNLKALIDSNNTNMAKVSKQTGITTAALSRYVNQKRDPELAYVIKLAQFFGVSIDWLIGLTEKESREDALEITDAYRFATPEDKRVVHAVLDKYIRNNQQ